MLRVLTVVLLVLFIATSAMAIRPPRYCDYDEGWGMCDVKWEFKTGYWADTGIWNPAMRTWIVGFEGCHTPIPIEYSDINLNLWIELYSAQSYRYLNYYWHRLGNEAETISFVIEGRIRSNSPEYVGLMKKDEDIDKLYFRHDIFNNVNAGVDLDIDWVYRYGDGLDPPDYDCDDPCWHNIEPGCRGNMFFFIDEPCDHWFQFKGSFFLPYHVDDGYYSLTIGGCPAPEL